MSGGLWSIRLLTLAAIMVAAPLALAQTKGQGGAGGAGPGGGQQPGGQQHMFLFFDEDGDGTISRTEFEAAGAQRFADADANDDGNLTMDEFKGSRPAQGNRAQAMFKSLDADGNGVVDAEEFQVFAETRFDSADKDGNGVLSGEELASLSRARSGSAGGTPGGSGLNR